MPTALAIVVTTCADKANAELIAMSLVEKSLAACVQMFPIASVYRWEGAVQKADEWMLLCKTKTADYAKVEAAIRAIHPYSNPEIVEIAIERGAQAYLDWIFSVTGGG
ncbi:MAG TPA: divalent-cation tolerance protein CutA [Methylocella sp.]|nr:divalent-cation tolerance protein CutA [Methylocella sp.]